MNLELQKKVKELRAEGNSYAKIGAALGISAAYAHVLDKPELYNTEKKKNQRKQYRENAKEYNRKYLKEWRKNNPNYMKEWYQANKDKYKEYNKKHSS